MELNFNCTGNERKRLVNTISEITGAPIKYLGAPSFAYQVDYFTIDRNGGVSFGDRADSEEIKNLIDTLGSQGFTAELKVDETFGPVEPATAEADGLCISMPASLFSEMALQNLKDIAVAKGNLIRKALDVEELPIEVSETKVSFPWFAGSVPGYWFCRVIASLRVCAALSISVCRRSLCSSSASRSEISL